MDAGIKRKTEDNQGKDDLEKRAKRSYLVSFWKLFLIVQFLFDKIRQYRFLLISDF